MCGVNVPQRTIERMDAQAYIEGQSVQWEMVEMPPEHLKLIRCPLIAPISDTEIAFLRFGHPLNVRKQDRWMTPYTPGGVAIYDVVSGNVTDVA